MSAKRTLAAVLLCGAIGAAVWQWNAVAGLRKQNNHLRPLVEESARLESENLELSSLRAAAGRETPSIDGKAELLRLRNDVGRLRAQRADLDRLKSENARLAAAVDAGAGAQQMFSDTEGFVAKESWGNAGFDTPEAAVQTFFWAMREGDFARLAECVPEKDRRYLAALAEPGHEEERDKMLADFQGMTAGIGFRVVEKTVLEEAFPTKDGVVLPDAPRIPIRVLLKLQAVAGGSVWPVSLKLYPDGWKLKDL